MGTVRKVVRGAEGNQGDYPRTGGPERSHTMSRPMWLLLILLILLYGYAGDLEYKDRLATESAGVQAADAVPRW